MFEEVRTRIPFMTAWLESSHGTQPILHFGEYIILSQWGIQQGDSLGLLYFSLTLQPIAECIKAKVPWLKINAW